MLIKRQRECLALPSPLHHIHNVSKEEKENERHFTEIYNIELVKGFIGDSISIYINDSLLMNNKIASDSARLTVKRFADESALLVVDNFTEQVSTFNLSEKGGNILLRKENGMILQEGETK